MITMSMLKCLRNKLIYNYLYQICVNLGIGVYIVRPSIFYNNSAKDQSLLQIKCIKFKEKLTAHYRQGVSILHFFQYFVGL